MKFLLGLTLLAVAFMGASAQSLEIVSPNHAYTFAYGDAFSHQIERGQLFVLRESRPGQERMPDIAIDRILCPGSGNRQQQAYCRKTGHKGRSPTCTRMCHNAFPRIEHGGSQAREIVISSLVNSTAHL